MGMMSGVKQALENREAELLSRISYGPSEETDSSVGEPVKRRNDAWELVIVREMQGKYEIKAKKQREAIGSAKRGDWVEREAWE